jgi:hypothetical protein
MESYFLLAASAANSICQTLTKRVEVMTAFGVRHQGAMLTRKSQMIGPVEIHLAAKLLCFAK